MNMTLVSGIHYTTSVEYRLRNPLSTSPKSAIMISGPTFFVKQAETLVFLAIKFM